MIKKTYTIIYHLFSNQKRYRSLKCLSAIWYPFCFFRLSFSFERLPSSPACRKYFLFPLHTTETRTTRRITNTRVPERIIINNYRRYSRMRKIQRNILCCTHGVHHVLVYSRVYFAVHSVYVYSRFGRRT